MGYYNNTENQRKETTKKEDRLRSYCSSILWASIWQKMIEPHRYFIFFEIIFSVFLRHFHHLFSKRRHGLDFVRNLKSPIIGKYSIIQLENVALIHSVAMTKENISLNWITPLKAIPFYSMEDRKKDRERGKKKKSARETEKSENNRTKSGIRIEFELHISRVI